MVGELKPRWFRSVLQATIWRSKSSKKNPEGVVRHGLKKCGACRKEFTLRHGAIFEESHLDRLTRKLEFDREILAEVDDDEDNGGL